MKNEGEEERRMNEKKEYCTNTSHSPMKEKGMVDTRAKIYKQ